MGIDDDGRPWCFETAPRPDPLRRFDAATDGSGEGVPVPGGAGTVRHMEYDEARDGRAPVIDPGDSRSTGCPRVAGMLRESPMSACLPDSGRPRSPAAAGQPLLPSVLALSLALAGPGAALAAVHQVHASASGWQPPHLTIQVGDSVRWNNDTGVSHNVMSVDETWGRRDGGSQQDNSLPWAWSRTFEQPGEYRYYCWYHHERDASGTVIGGEVGTILVEGEAQEDPEPSFTIVDGVSGSWFDPSTPGQGLLLEVSAGLGVVAMAWFTFAPDGSGRDWFTGSGTFAGHLAELTLFRSSGGRFDAADAVETVPVGEAALAFDSCTSATLSYVIDDQPPRSGEIPLARVLPAPAGCGAPAGD